MPRLSHEKRVGIFFIITVLLTISMIFLFGKIRPFRRGYHIIVTFNHVSGLGVGDEVRLAGLRVGEVSALETSENKIRVTLWIQEKTKIREDSRITISQISIMGGKFVSISPGTPHSPIISKEATVIGTDPPRFEDVVTEIGETGNEIRSSVIKLSEAFSKTAEQTNQILEENREAVKKLINSLNETTESLNKILTKIEEGEGTVGKLVNEEELYDEVLQAVKDLRQTTEEIKTTVKDIKPPLKAAIENIEIITGRLERGEGTLGRMLKSRTTQRTTQDGNKGYIK